MNDKTSAPVPTSSRRARRLRLIGVLVLALGVGGASIAYWLGMRNANLNDNLSMQGFNRAEQHQMGQLYGKSGLLIDEWSDDLKQPGTQAVIIVVFSTLITAGCFYFARLLDYDDETG